MTLLCGAARQRHQVGADALAHLAGARPLGQHPRVVLVGGQHVLAHRARAGHVLPLLDARQTVVVRARQTDLGAPIHADAALERSLRRRDVRGRCVRRCGCAHQIESLWERSVRFGYKFNYNGSFGTRRKYVFYHLYHVSFVNSFKMLLFIGKLSIHIKLKYCLL